MNTRDRTELTTYSREDLEHMAKWTATSTVMNPTTDKIGEQRARWVRGALEISTDYTQSVNIGA